MVILALHETHGQAKKQLPRQPVILQDTHTCGHTTFSGQLLETVWFSNPNWVNTLNAYPKADGSLLTVDFVATGVDVSMWGPDFPIHPDICTIFVCGKEAAPQSEFQDGSTIVGGCLQ